MLALYSDRSASLCPTKYWDQRCPPHYIQLIKKINKLLHLLICVCVHLWNDVCRNQRIIYGHRFFHSTLIPGIKVKSLAIVLKPLSVESSPWSGNIFLVKSLSSFKSFVYYYLFISLFSEWVLSFFPYCIHGVLILFLFVCICYVCMYM